MQLEYSNLEITKVLKEEDGEKAFELMHKELDKVWDETFRVLKNGGILYISFPFIFDYDR